MEKTKRTALLELLFDPDDEIFHSVYSELKSEGEDIIPEIEKIIDKVDDLELQDRLTLLLKEIRATSLKSKLKKWSQGDKRSLLDASFYIASNQYPELKKEDIIATLEIITQDIWLEINEYLTGFEKVKIINKILFDYYSFKVTENSGMHYMYLNYLLNTKKGHSLPFTIFYLTICQKLDLPVYAVYIPNNLILAYMDEYLPEERVLFYINPSKTGAFLSKKEIDYYLYQSKIDPDPSYYKPSDNKEVIKLYLRSMVISSEKAGNNEKAKMFNDIYKNLNE